MIARALGYLVALCLLCACGEEVPRPPVEPLAASEYQLAALYKWGKGPLDVNVAPELQLVDRRRDEPLSINVYYPADDVDGLPVLLFSHGNFSDNNAYDRVLSHWVSHGYVVVAPLHADGDGGYLGATLDMLTIGNLGIIQRRYEDLQIVRFGPTEANPDFGSFITDNLGEAEILGVELEFTWLATENFTLSGNYAYLDTEVDDLVLQVAGGGLDVSGSNLRQAPENKASLTASYDIPLSSGGFVNLRGDYTYVDEQINDYANQNTIIEEIELWDARIGWTSASGRWQAAVWGKNLADERVITHSYVIGPGVIGVWNAPRTYGVSLSWAM